MAYKPRAYPPRLPDNQAQDAGFRTGSHNVQREERADRTIADSSRTKNEETTPKQEVDISRRSKSKQRSSIGIVRARPVSANRKHSRTRSNTGGSSTADANLYDSTHQPDDMMQSGAGDGLKEDVSLAQLQEMRERSKVLRDQVLQVQRTVQSKEGQLQRLKNERLPSDEIRQENDKLARLQDRINMQEARLRKLKETKGKIAQQVIINSTMNAELDGLKSILSNKEKEIGEIDQLINQLNTKIQQAKTENANKNSKRAHNLNRIDKLKQEMLSHKRVTESVQGKFSTQREAVQSKKEEMNKVDLQIAELWRKLQQAKAAAHQQAPQKPATAIAAVGPFEHKPHGTPTSPPSNIPTPQKPQEIDIKLVERNGGSGQSSPNVSADEREPYSSRSVKPPPFPPTVNGSVSSPRSSPRSYDHSQRIRGQSVDLPNSRKGARASPTQSGERRGSPNNQMTRSDRDRNGPAPGVPHSFSDPSLQHQTSSNMMRPDTRGDKLQRTNPPPPQTHRVTSPVLRVSSPRSAPVGEMKLEKGPVHQFRQITQPTSKSGQVTPDSPANKPKNFNAKPRPFGSAPVPSQQQNQGKPRVETNLDDNDQTYQQQPVTPAMNPADRGDFRPPPPLDRRDRSTDDAKSAREAITSFNQRVYPATPIMGRHQLNTGNQSAGPSSPKHSQGNNNMSPQHQLPTTNKQDNESPQHKAQTPRYATRSQISDTYIPQVNKDRLDQYRRDMEKAVRDASTPQNTSSPTLSSASSSPLPDPPEPLPQQSGEDDSTPTVHIEDIIPPPPIPESPPPPPPPGVEASGGDADRETEDSGALTVITPATEPPRQVISPPTIPGEIISSAEEKRPVLDYVEIYNDTDPETMKHIKPIINRKNKDQVDGAVLSRSDNARFHPLVILLDTALNGTVDEVQTVLPRVPDPSASNDEGITALHNAICAGHLDIVQTLVEFGVDVNAVDTDGWTPLHCAASCNNQPVVEYLISRGACILATTYSDSETAREKCEMDEEGYDGTSKCLYNMEMKLGADDVVYCVYDYKAESSDELTLQINDKLSILRRGDKQEQDWWWAKCGDREGYVAKNLLAFTPRVKPQYVTGEPEK